jgi:polysaccharide deacetylase family protein (PEP-CTERM system associated)
LFNVLTVDVEDYYHVSAFEAHISNNNWEFLPSRVEYNIKRILEILDTYDVKATFFVLGWVAERSPSLIREIHNQGHEIACHGYMHKLVYQSTIDDFRIDVRKAKSIIEDSIGCRINGFRATSFSFIEETLWALDILIEEGFMYDSSIFPVRHDRYGIPRWQRFPHRIARNGKSIYELPPSTIRIFRNNIPIAGGAYLRFLPLSLITWGIRRINNTETNPAVLYIHPWEIDAGQPRIRVSKIAELRHYAGINGVEDKIREILDEFDFGTAQDLIETTFGN